MRGTRRGFVVLLGVITLVASRGYVTSMYQPLLFTGALAASTIWPTAYATLLVFCQLQGGPCGQGQQLCGWAGSLLSRGPILRCAWRRCRLL